jgi:CRP-like cAMP-binding protein
MIQKLKTGLRLIEFLKDNKISLASTNLIMSKVEIIEVKKRTSLVKVGDICDSGYFILDGSFISRVYSDKTNKSITSNFFLHDFNPYMSCEDSFFSGEKTKTELIAIKDSTVIQFKKNDIDWLIANSPELANFYINNILANLLKHETVFRKILTTLSKEEIYNYLIEKCNPVIKNIPSKYIAEFMGISPEWLSKTKNKN